MAGRWALSRSVFSFARRTIALGSRDSGVSRPLAPKLHLGARVSAKLRFHGPLRTAEVELRPQRIPKWNSGARVHKCL